MSNMRCSEYRPYASYTASSGQVWCEREEDGADWDAPCEVEGPERELLEEELCGAGRARVACLGRCDVITLRHEDGDAG